MCSEQNDPQIIPDEWCKDLNNVCMFCGNPMGEYWDEQTKYYECHCSSAKLDRLITQKIELLESNRPPKLYRIGSCLKKI